MLSPLSFHASLHPVNLVIGAFLGGFYVSHCTPSALREYLVHPLGISFNSQLVLPEGRKCKNHNHKRKLSPIKFWSQQCKPNFIPFQVPRCSVLSTNLYVSHIIIPWDRAKQIISSVKCPQPV